MRGFREKIRKRICFTVPYDEYFQTSFMHTFMHYKLGGNVILFIQNPTQRTVRQMLSYILFNINPKRSGFNIETKKRLEITSRILEELE